MEVTKNKKFAIFVTNIHLAYCKNYELFIFRNKMYNLLVNIFFKVYPWIILSVVGKRREKMTDRLYNGF